ncbi:MAG: glucose-1-phosphate adenylyltransferase subunit GlgD [Clostridiales bacterium]|nr:glucose-1-phosphate adenylyltransferase subunit GlgD [Clostridiales bacterium]
MNNCLGIINLDENESRMGELVRFRTLAAIPISARYRIIDFVLSNMANSGIHGIGIFTPKKSRSLINHITNGRSWDLHRKKDGLRIFNFGDYDPFYDDVRNFLDNMEFIEQSRKEYVLISPSYMICNIDYNNVLKKHIKDKNDITIVGKTVSNADEKFLGCEVLNLNNKERVISIGRNIGIEKNAIINMEMIIMKTELFVNIIYECVNTGIHRKIKEYIKSNLDNLKVGIYKFNGYLSCINSIKEYFDTNLDILNQDINNELFYCTNPIYTKSQDEPPTKYTENSRVLNSIIANGSYIEGEVRNCIIGRRVRIGKGAKIENCVIMQNSIIEDNVVMDKVVVDKGTLISENEKIKGTSNYPVTIQKQKTFLME